jgi:mRNA-decapping enzyme subunit 2
MVKGMQKKSSWMFPRGKINRDESSLDCARREVARCATGTDLIGFPHQVMEEIDFDIGPYTQESLKIEGKYGIFMWLWESAPRCLITRTAGEQAVVFYLVPGISEDTPFRTHTRNEISVRVCDCICGCDAASQDIKWFFLKDLSANRLDSDTSFFFVKPVIK